MVALSKYSALVSSQKSPFSHLVPAGGNLMCFEILLCLDLISQRDIELDLMLRKTLSFIICVVVVLWFLLEIEKVDVLLK